ncbi:FtsH protease activity modulator HflK [Aquibacillus koreensis]|uniref:Protein HflK n=1 Tax=Aquibacillus koreensis TaxID=279446 RepID=A0A9X3WGC3_9BACI|nr:FtsH protease activity modulator HflK [Aquibacillus koreensis]MCT2537188.1 FtsH protease activity modulator HflK [Aquibacillus koreensis]MDC3419240.1 FtsH protease activity modulator HflK [Aquibacillus koreensis]
MTLKQIYSWLGIVIAIVILGFVGLTSWYTVDESDQAVILTFGKAEEAVTESGLHFKLPWPLQEVEKLSKETFSLDLGLDDTDTVRMITGDEKIIQANLVVQWKIAEPEKFLFESTDPETILNNGTSAALRSIIGSSTIDEALTDGKAKVENEVRELLISLIDDYDIGISISDVKLQEVDLPNEEVRQAFMTVTDARETMNTKKNEAEKYENQQREEALGEKDAIISRAEGDKIERIEIARGNVAEFNALYEAYQNSPDITRERLLLETLDQVLADANVYIMNDDGDTLKYLPLNPNNTNTRTTTPVPSSDDNNNSTATEEGEKNE